MWRITLVPSATFSCKDTWAETSTVTADSSSVKVDALSVSSQVTVMVIFVPLVMVPAVPPSP